MRRQLVLGTLVGVGVLSMSVVAAVQQPAAPQPRVVKVEKLRDNLFMMLGGGGNSAVFVGTNGVVVVDTKNPGWGQPLLDQIKMVTDKPITTIINTHTHGDHVSGNVEFPENVEVIVHQNTRANMEKMAVPTGFPAQPDAVNIFVANKGRGTAKRTFTDRLTVGSGNDQVNLLYFGRGHTNGDAWVVFPALRVAHAGDIFAGKQIPLLDANNGGSGVEIGNTLAKAADGLGNVETIITGHSTTMTVADLRQYAEFNREFAAAVAAGKKAGQTVDQIAASWKMPAKYAGYAEPQAMRLRSNVQVVFDETR
jgi:glyoxylase-like metal-dependent hydrolase (beta-lactamase superfamily II)